MFGKVESGAPQLTSKGQQGFPSLLLDIHMAVTRAQG